ncbi:hypothetical protein SAMN05444158_2172 [Bradyrhizobium canariense]|uniref:Uncharacterized protein n=1 Tax=Bradyrhizobium canariense TaxID=255045 RepID=A0A1H1SHP5_9BRAD|nr:hypothetical protein SAMN05444158_2172 [Bradyrhizobium canariense]
MSVRIKSLERKTQRARSKEWGVAEDMAKPLRDREWDVTGRPVHKSLCPLASLAGCVVCTQPGMMGRFALKKAR